MKICTIFIFFLLSFHAFAETGILFIAHGTAMNHDGHLRTSCTPHHVPEWEKYVLSSIESMRASIPKKIEVAFGMWESDCFDEAILKLQENIKKEGKILDHVVVFPLFISTHSEVIEMQKYIFKKRPDKVIPLPHVHQTFFDGKITYLDAFDYDPKISMILSNRLHDLVQKGNEKGYAPQQLELVLVMHGPVDEKANLQWIKMGEEYNRDLMLSLPLYKSHVISLRDDADDEIRNKMTTELREKIIDARTNHRMPILLPLLISKGGIDQGIMERVSDLEFIWLGQALFPDDKLKDVILPRLKEFLF